MGLAGSSFLPGKMVVDLRTSSCSPSFVMHLGPHYHRLVCNHHFFLVQFSFLFIAVPPVEVCLDPQRERSSVMATCRSALSSWSADVSGHTASEPTLWSFSGRTRSLRMYGSSPPPIFFCAPQVMIDLGTSFQLRKNWSIVHRMSGAVIRWAPVSAHEDTTCHMPFEPVYQLNG